jgi:hypothetical protein
MLLLFPALFVFCSSSKFQCQTFKAGKKSRLFKALLLFTTILSCVSFSECYYIYTFAGNGIRGYQGDGGPATSAELWNPAGVAVSSTGEVYIADTSNQRIRVVFTNGIITTFAGNGNTYCTNGNCYGGYSGDGGPATSAELNNPNGVAVSSTGEVYIADYSNNVIRVVNTNGIINTFAGNGYTYCTNGVCNGGYSGDGGPATIAELNNPNGVAVSSTGEVYIADSNNQRIRVVNTNGIINTFAGNGYAYCTNGVCNGGYSGDGGPATSARLNYPTGVAISSTGEVYIADYSNQRIRNVSCSPGYTGYNCQFSICYGISGSLNSVCSGNGECISPNNCQCNTGYTGYNCELSICYGFNQTSGNVCSGNGACIGPNNCECNSGYTGYNCQLVSCYGMNQSASNVCSGNGACIGPNNCECNSGYTGYNCQLVSCYGVNQTSNIVCSGHGTCIEANNCECFAGFMGNECEFMTCYGINSSSNDVCSGHGSCIGPNNCVCNGNYSGTICQYPICYGVSEGTGSTCSGNGHCASPNNCTCIDGYVGKECEYYACFGHSHISPKVCTGHGTCQGPNFCQCYTRYYGSDCSSERKLKYLAFLAFLIPLVVIIIATFIFYYYKLRKQKRKEKMLYQKLMEYEMPEKEEVNTENFAAKDLKINLNQLSFTAKISEGTGGIVYKGLWYQKVVAIKKLKVADADLFAREISTLNRLRHPNVLELYGYSIDSKGYQYIITEYMEKESLDSLIYNKKLRNFEEKIRSLLEIAQGMRFLHEKGIMHRDLKPQNVLVNKDNVCKISDFGLAKVVNGSLTLGMVGTWQYMAPEILNESGKYDEKCDVYSFGIMMHEIFTLSKPYATSEFQSQFTIATKILNGQRPEILPEILPEIIVEDQTPEMALNAKHYFFKSNELSDSLKLSNIDIFNIVRMYFKLCRLCWSSDASERPTFYQIVMNIQEIQNLLRRKN